MLHTNSHLLSVIEVCSSDGTTFKACNIGNMDDSVCTLNNCMQYGSKILSLETAEDWYELTIAISFWWC